MDTTWKNRLQEHCQKNKIALPNYRVKNQSGPSHILKFQVEVEVNGHWYVGDDLCSSKKEAEQSAAREALDALLSTNLYPISTPSSAGPSIVPAPDEHSELPPSYSEVVREDSIDHLPIEYADIKQFITTKIGRSGGRIRKIWPSDSQGRYKFEITGSYRYCEKIKRHHKKNQIYFIIDPIKRTYFQKCHDPECYGFKSKIKNIANEQWSVINSQENNSMGECSHCRSSFSYKNRQKCERCGELFCRNCVCHCELCHDAIHCERCFSSCFDCHDS